MLQALKAVVILESKETIEARGSRNESLVLVETNGLGPAPEL